MQKQASVNAAKAATVTTLLPTWRSVICPSSDFIFGGADGAFGSGVYVGLKLISVCSPLADGRDPRNSGPGDVDDAFGGIGELEDNDVVSDVDVSD